MPLHHTQQTHSQPHLAASTQQAISSQPQATAPFQLHTSSHSHAPFQPCSHFRHLEAIPPTNEAEGEEFDFTGVEHNDIFNIQSNLATVNSTPSPSVQVQAVVPSEKKGLEGGS